MRKKNALSAVVSAACCALAALLLFAALLFEIRLGVAEDEIRELRRESVKLAEKRSVLRVRVANRLTLEEIERYATEELGMQRCRPGQIVELEILP